MSHRQKHPVRHWAASALLAASWGVWSLAQAQTSVTIDCSPNSLAQLNTGQPSTSNAQVDSRWRFQYLSAYAGSDPANWRSFGDATIVTSRVSSWTSTPAASSTAQWIAANAWGGQPYVDGANFGNIDALFQVQFSIDPAVSLGSFAPSMTYSADNSVVDIFINGKSQLARGLGTWGLPQAGSTNQFNYNGFGTNRWLTIASMASPDWQAGANTMTVYVKSGNPYMGFAAAISGSNACLPNDAPAATPAVSGQPDVGQTLTGTYGYADTESDPEDSSATGTRYQWVRSDNASLTQAAQGTVLQSGNTLGAAGTVTYTTQAADDKAYLYYCVTPVAVRGTLVGPEVCSAAFGPVKTTTTPPQPATPQAVPALDIWALLGMSGLVAAWGLARSRKRVRA
ncbi:IPTL-CTERM sorting domain-containing protein [Comamonas sp.]|uniref:IPTL-CTERM sorting domain-containing protein n=1 Tax=Comamonas sp. TaxID=34028 RepID=UPI00289A30BC|nr:IPTL-CTERM sorting domain-containing protein [Comamonas sp.]